MHSLRRTCLFLVAVTLPVILAAQDYMRSTAEAGQRGGRLSIALAAEPKTLNPITAIDQNSRAVLWRTAADLIHINRSTLKPEPALAKSWTVSRDGTQVTLKLRQGLRFSDGVPFNADDVTFTWRVYLDEKVGAPQRDLLTIFGKPVTVKKLDNFTVQFTIPAPYAAGDRIFDSIAILPQHLLEKDYAAGTLQQAWTLNTPPEKMAGLGPFRVKKIVPGSSVILERNPYYWKNDSKRQQLPYLDELTFLAVPTQDAQVVRFEAGDTQVLNTLSGENFAALVKDQQSHGYKLIDVGPGLEYNILFFNLNTDTQGKLPEINRKQKWFNDVRFRRAVSFAVDRAGIVRLVYRGRGAPLATHVTPANKYWINNAIAVPQHSIDQARQSLKDAGFTWKADGGLQDASGQAVEFSIVVSSSSQPRIEMATLIQDDLKQLGMKVNVVPMSSGSLIDRVSNSHDFEAALMGFGGADADPNPEIGLLTSNGSTHLWHSGENKPSTPWQAEIDQLMQEQKTALSYAARKKLYDRVQEIIAQQLPFIPLVSPHILVAAKDDLGNFQPAILEHYTLWNAEELFWRTPGKNK